MQVATSGGREMGRSRPRAPAALYSALSLALVVLIAGLAFSARQPPPPQIAELTPQAQHQITKAPTEQSSSLGSANGGAGAAEGGAGTTVAAPTTSTAAQRSPLAPIDVAAVHHCFGNPPRQIKDTQSPPCVAYWVGNNGGATSRGVTASTITVLWHSGGFDQNDARVLLDLQTFFNRYFEFYGRHLYLINYGPPSGTCAAVASAATGAVEQYQPFAVTDPGQDDTACSLLAVAGDHAISVGGNVWFDQSTMSRYAPYLWQYPMDSSSEFANTARFVCDQLAGKKASYAPEASLASQTRRFGLLFEYEQSPYPYDLSPLTAGLASCGVKLAATETYEDQGGGVDQSSSQWTTQAILNMKQAGVTTVLCYCLTSNPWPALESTIAPAADAQDYYPEWMLAWQNGADAVVVPSWPQADQRQALLGINFGPAQVPYPSATLNWALEAVDPGFQVDYNALMYQAYQAAYEQLLLVASGIQMAGPDLTPATFQRGLQDARFPNPPSPQMEGAVGFSGGSHSMTLDAEVMWWDNSAQSPYPDEGPGAWCYVDGGERFTMSSWATPMTFFSGPCDSSPPGS